MLKGIPKVISPELIKILMEMGHGDEIVIADGNFPSASMAKRLVRCDGLSVPEVLDAILKLFPLDTKYSPNAVFLMEVVPGDTIETPIWKEYRQIIQKHTSQFKDFGSIERFAFYEAAKNAYAVVATSEKALYANIILRKGVVID
jgi:L-fucose mutarotase